MGGRRPGAVAPAATTAVTVATVATVAVLVVLAGACGGDADGGAAKAVPVRIGPLTPRDPGRISAEQQAAIRELARSPRPPEPHAAHMDDAAPSTVALSAAQAGSFRAEWSAARAAAGSLDIAAEATAAGYVPASVFLHGIGAHWVNWTLVDAPFDPAHPSMLLFDDRDGAPQLVGFSYWIRADDPGGFTGPNDVWHQHTDLCVVNGWVDRERAATRADCAGSFLAGGDLWMLHAWLVPGHENRAGTFAAVNPALCPPAAGVPDDLRCP